MSQENLDALTKGYEAFQRGDIDAAFSNWSDDITIRGGSDLVPAGGTYHGIDEVKGRWLAEFGAAYEDFRMTIEETIVTDDRICVLGTARGRLRGVTDEIKGPFAHIWKFDGDKIVEARFFNDTAQTYAAIHEREGAQTG